MGLLFSLHPFSLISLLFKPINQHVRLNEWHLVLLQPMIELVDVEQ
jgi:hypothetical protein